MSPLLEAGMVVLAVFIVVFSLVVETLTHAGHSKYERWLSTAMVVFSIVGAVVMVLWAIGLSPSKYVIGTYLVYVGSGAAQITISIGGRIRGR